MAPQRPPLPSRGVTAQTRAAWQAKKELPVWGKRDLGRDVTAARSLAASARSSADPEAQSLREARKAAWVAKQDLPVGGIETLGGVAAERAAQGWGRDPSTARSEGEAARAVAKAKWLQKQGLPMGGPEGARAPGLPRR